MAAATDLLSDGLEDLGISYTNRQLQQLALFIDEIDLWNSDSRRNKPGLNLVKASGDELIIRHILDSLAALPIIRRYDPGTIADAGSGAGFPGIPFAVFLSNIQFTLVERSGKKAAFLSNATARLELENVIIEDIPLQQVRGTFDAVTFRALKRLDLIMDDVKKITSPNGIIAAYKGRAAEIEDEIAGLDEDSVEVYPLDVPFLREERHLVVIHLNRVS